MKKKVLISVHSEYAKKIFSGEKKYEYRKQIWQDRDVDTVMIYVTKPVNAVVGEFKISRILRGTKNHLWEVTSKKSGVSKEFYDKYFMTKNIVFAIEIGKITKYKIPIEITFHPPQSFMYYF
jgi:predicted transcriptional regulator